MPQTNFITFSEDHSHPLVFLKLPRGLQCAVRSESHCSKTEVLQGGPQSIRTSWNLCCTPTHWFRDRGLGRRTTLGQALQTILMHALA